MGKRKLITDYLYNLSYQLLLIALPLITIPYISRTIGAEGIGKYSFVQSIASYFILVGNLGINTYGQRLVASNKDDNHVRSKIFIELLILKAITIFISLTFYSVFFLQTEQYTLLYSIMLIDIFTNIFDISWFFQGIEEFRKIVIRNFVIKILSLISIFIFVNNENDLVVYILIQSFSYLISNFSLFAYLPQYIIKVSLSSLNFSIHLRGIFSLFIAQIAYHIYSVLDKTMIGIIVSNISAVGYFEQSQKLIKICLTVVSSLGTIMLSKIAVLYSKQDYESISNYIYKSYRFSIMLSIPIMFGIIGISSGLVPWFYGNGFDEVSTLLKQISPIIVFMAISGVTGTQYLVPTGKQKFYNISLIIGALVNFLLNLVLINKFNENGAAVASVLAEFSVMSIQLYFVRDMIKVKIILQMSNKYIISGLIMFLSVYCLESILSISALNTFISIFVGFMIYMICLFILKDEMVKPAFDKLLKK